MRPVLDRPQHRQELPQIVPVNRTEVRKAQSLEQSTANGHTLEQILGPLCPLSERFGKEAHSALRGLFQILKWRTRIKLREVGGQRAHRRRDAHLVVVENDDQTFLQMARIVHRLIGHSRAHRAIADHRDCITMPGVAVSAQLARHSEAQSGRDRGRTVCRAKGVIRRF